MLNERLFILFLLLFLLSDVLPNITYDVIQGTHDLGHRKGGGLFTTAFRRIKNKTSDYFSIYQNCAVCSFGTLGDVKNEFYTSLIDGFHLLLKTLLPTPFFLYSSAVAEVRGSAEASSFQWRLQTGWIESGSNRGGGQSRVTEIK